MKVLVTGASGVLGTAVYDAFLRSANAAVAGLAYSRAGGERNLQKADLLDANELRKAVTSWGGKTGDWLIHCAAERKPDVAEKDPEGTRKLNVTVPENLAQLSKELGFTLVYISTDYVFDGTSPPYVPSARTNPLNFYGITKRDGEIAVLGVEGARVVVLRVPVLYGPTPSNADSAINILVDVVKDQSGKKYTMDHFQTRYPTNVLDIAGFLVRLSALPKNVTIPPILHYSAPEPYTKYEICLIFARILNVSHDHIKPETNPPVGATPRPHDTQLYVRETEDLVGLGAESFVGWWETYLTGSSSDT
ncbi:NAD-P-binding protein [Auriscalpium vulgare]|uniref:NAD-P-binding protein n=1 Tax=Auriscalpium vulgare TaxID=40419 RepID=A0ACB8S6Q2_9AGAM|nr:NAD-P-binding protein [Auriscalpium vulgare]